MKDVKTLIFDFDGTLVDSMPAWSQKMTNILDREGIVYPKNIIEIITPLGDRGAAEYFRQEFGLSRTVAELVEEMDVFALPAYRDTIPLKETVGETLRTLKAAGYSLNVLTASPHRMLDPCLKRNGIYTLFDHVWSCEDFETTKSDPAIYTRAAAACGTAVEACLFLDDNKNACKTARAAGMPACGVYDETSKKQRDEIRKICCGSYIDKMEELLPLLGR